MKNNNIINPDLDKVTFTDRDIYLDWEQKEKESVLQYLKTNGVERQQGSLDGGQVTIIVNGKYYRVFYSTRHIGYPCDVSKYGMQDHKPNWKEILAKKQADYQKWQEQNPNAPFRRYHYQLTPKEDIPIQKMEMPTAKIFFQDFNFKKFKVITLCGSTKFKEQFMEYNKKFTLQGNVVLSVGVFGHSDKDSVLTVPQKQLLDKVHLQKIDMSDEIFVINKGGYIGQSTQRQIQYANSKNKIVSYMEKV